MKGGPLLFLNCLRCPTGFCLRLQAIMRRCAEKSRLLCQETGLRRALEETRQRAQELESQLAAARLVGVASESQALRAVEEKAEAERQAVEARAAAEAACREKDAALLEKGRVEAKAADLQIAVNNAAVNL